MNDENNVGKEVALENIITSAIQIPGVKVDRKKISCRNICKPRCNHSRCA